MPQQMWRPTCQCNLGIHSMGSPNCRNCGQPGQYDGWHLGMYEAMAAYTKRTGMAPIGPHRRLTDELLAGRSVLCRTCDGRGVLDAEGGRTWKDCPSCQGLGCFFRGTMREFLEIRSRILEQFPKAASASFKPDEKLMRYCAAPGQEDGEKDLWIVQRRLAPEAEIRCVFYTLAVRNEALKKKWRGGLSDYWSRYNTIHNAGLTVSCFMGPYWDEQFEALIANGLEERKDFIVFDASNVILMKDFELFHFRVDWLDGFVHKAGVMIHIKQ